MMIRVVSKFKLLTVEQKGCLSYHNGNIYFQHELTEKPARICELPISSIKRFSCKFRLFERIFRLEPRCAISINEDEYLLSYHGAIYRVNVKDKSMVTEHLFRSGMNNVLTFCKYTDKSGSTHILYGEYFSNDSKESVAIYERNFKNTSWEKVFEFSAGMVKHIHGIIYDSFREQLNILTGDSDTESAIWKADLNFNIVEPIIAGKQKFRACALYPVKDGFIYATDSPDEKNAIFYLKYKKYGFTLNKLYDMPGPCIYSTLLNDGNKMVFATSVEPDSTLSKLYYRITYKLGKGVVDRKTHIIIGNLSSGFEDILSIEKDIWPMWLFQYGNIQFPQMDNSKILYMAPTALRKYDGKTIAIYTDKILI